MAAAVDHKKEEFRKYLERNGVVDALTKVLVSLYEEPEKPSDPLEFLKEILGTGPNEEALKTEVAALKKENAELKTKLAQYEK